MRTSIIIIATAILTVSCTAKKPMVITNTVTETITEKVRDTIFRIEKDSSSYKALLECQNGKVVLKKIVQTRAGKNLNVPSISVVDNVLSADCEAREQEFRAQIKSLEIRLSESSQIPIEVERELTFIENAFIKVGQAATFLLLLILLIWIINKQLKAYNLKK